MKYFEDRFGIGLRVFAGFRLLEGRQTCWLLHRSPYIEMARSLRVHTAGIPVLRKIKHQPKPTTAALQIFGSKASRNVMNLEGHQLTDLLENNAIVVHLPVTPGYVILTYQKHILGCGLYTGKRLLSQIPRSYMALP